MQKTHDHCKTPGCFELGTNQPHDEYPNIRFCDKHCNQLLVATVKSIVNGTHHVLLKERNANKKTQALKETA